MPKHADRPLKQTYFASLRLTFNLNQTYFASLRLTFNLNQTYFASLRLTFNLKPNLEVYEYFEGQNLAKRYNGNYGKVTRLLVPLYRFLFT